MIPLPLPLPVPLPCPLTAVRIISLRATVMLLLILLIKSNLLRVKMAALGSLLGLLFALTALAGMGLLSLVAGGAVAYGVQQRRRVSG